MLPLDTCVSIQSAVATFDRYWETVTVADATLYLPVESHVENNTFHATKTQIVVTLRSTTINHKSKTMIFKP